MASEMLESERRLLATDRRQSNGGGVDHRDPEQHRRAVLDRASEALKTPRRVPHPSLAGGRRYCAS